MRTLLGRIESSKVAKDRRDAAEQLAAIQHVGQYFLPADATMIMNTLRFAADDRDSDCVTKLMEVLVNATDPAGAGSEQRTAVLRELLDVPTLLQLLRQPSFWCRYFTVQLLSRLLEHGDATTLQKQLLSSNGVGALIDILNDTSNGGALRNEGLLLVSALTTNSSEIQTILVFENCFDTLFDIIKEEGGVLGDAVVNDCLGIMQNMLRNNKATQKYFVEMGCAKRLGELLASAAALLKAPEGNAAGNELTAQANSIVQGAMVVVGSLIRGGDANAEGGAIRIALSQSKILHSMCSVAFAAQQVELHVRVDALRTVAMILQGNRAACTEFLSIQTEVRRTPTAALWSLTRLALQEKDSTMQATAMSVVVALVETETAAAVSMLTNGVVGKPSAQSCGLLLREALFATTPATSMSVYNACTVLAYCVSAPPFGEALGSHPWGDDHASSGGATFFSVYLHHVMTVFQERTVDLATMSAMLRPLFMWFRMATKCIVSFLDDSEALQFIVDRSLNTRESAHSLFLFSGLVALACIMRPNVSGATTALSDEAVSALVQEKITPQRFLRLYRDVANTQEWQNAPARAALAPQPAIYDAMLVGIFGEIKQHMETIAGTAVPQPSMPSPTNARAGSIPRASSRVEPTAAARSTNTVSTMTDDVSVSSTAVAAEMNVAKEELIRLRAENEAQKASIQQHREAAEAFEEALRNKDEELQSLAQSLHALEQKLAQTKSENLQVEQLHGELASAREDIDELLLLVGELDEERLVLQSTLKSHGIALPEGPEEAPRSVVDPAAATPPRQPDLSADISLIPQEASEGGRTPQAEGAA